MGDVPLCCNELAVLPAPGLPPLSFVGIRQDALHSSGSFVALYETDRTSAALPGDVIADPYRA